MSKVSDAPKDTHCPSCGHLWVLHGFLMGCGGFKGEGDNPYFTAADSLRCNCTDLPQIKHKRE